MYFFLYMYRDSPSLVSCSTWLRQPPRKSRRMRTVWRRLLRAQRPGGKGRGGAESSGYKRLSANHHILRNHTWQVPSSVTTESFSAHMKVCAAHPSCTSQTCLRLFSLYFTSQPFLCFRTILHSPWFLLRGNRASKAQTVELACASSCSGQCARPWCTSVLTCIVGGTTASVTWVGVVRCKCVVIQLGVCFTEAPIFIPEVSG